MFESLTPMPPDAILGLMEAFRADPREGKIDLGVGIYKDDRGERPCCPPSRRRRSACLEAEATKAYVGPAGALGFNAGMGALLFGERGQAALKIV